MQKEESTVYAIPFNQGDWGSTLRAFKVINAFLQVGFTVLRANESSENFDRGDFLLPVVKSIEGKASRRAVEAFIERMVAESRVHLKTLHDIANVTGLLLKAPKIAIYQGAGADMVPFTTCLEKLGFTCFEYVTGKLIVKGILEGIDVLIMPGGDSSTIVTALGLDGCKRISDFIRSGGGYIGTCAGAFIPVKPLDMGRPEGPNRDEYQKPHHFLELLEFKVLNNLWENEIDFPVWSYFQHGDLIRVFPFVGNPSSTVRLRVVRQDHPVMFGYGEFIDVHMAGPIMEAGVGVEVLAEFYSPTTKTEYGLPEEIAWEMAARKAAIIAGRFGDGRLVLFGPHPEEFYEHTHPLIGNALFFLTCSGPRAFDISTLKGLDISLMPPINISKSCSSPYVAENKSVDFLDSLKDDVVKLNSDIKNLGTKAIDLVPTRVLDWYQYALVPLIDMTASKIDELIKIMPEILASYYGFNDLKWELDRYKARYPKANRFHVDLSCKVLAMAMESIAAYMDGGKSSLSELPEKVDRAAMSVKGISAEIKRIRRAQRYGKDITKLKEALGRKVMSSLFLINGGLYYMVPWYDARSGYVDDFNLGPDQPGIVAPLVQLALKARRISVFSEFTSAIVSH